MGIEIPQPFRSALQEGEPSRVADEPADSPESLYGRALARIQLGRDAEARADLEAAQPVLGDVCRIECAYMDIRGRAEPRKAMKTAQDICDRSPKDSQLVARAWHIRGLALGKMRRIAEAAAALVEALDTYGRRGDRQRQGAPEV